MKEKDFSRGMAAQNIQQADNESATVAIDKTVYTQEAKGLLSNIEFYKLLTEGPTGQYQKEIPERNS